MALFTHDTTVTAPADAVWRWHARPSAFDRLLPPWERAEVVERSGEGLASGSSVRLRTRFGPWRPEWTAVHVECEPPHRFIEVQRKSALGRWVHTHSFREEPRARGARTIVEDRVDYTLPLGRFGEWVAGRYVRERLKRLFHYRGRVMWHDIARHATEERATPLSVAVSGTHGLVGSALGQFLCTGGHSVRRIARWAKGEGEIAWDPSTGNFDRTRLEGLDAVVHLAGESLVGRRWSVEQKRRLWHSRLTSTRGLVRALTRLERPPKVLLCASAAGIYGDRSLEPLDEGSVAGHNFLSELCQEWERATEPARRAGIRVVNLRFGLVLSPRGGALAKLLVPLRLGAGAVVGDGDQHVSWVALDDALAAIHHVLLHEEFEGPVNVVSPFPVTHRELIGVLGRVVGRPVTLPVPAFAARFVLGDLVDELLLASQFVQPERLRSAGFTFTYPTLEGALRHLLGA